MTCDYRRDVVIHVYKHIFQVWTVEGKMFIPLFSEGRRWQKNVDDLDEQDNQIQLCEALAWLRY